MTNNNSSKSYTPKEAMLLAVQIAHLNGTAFGAVLLDAENRILLSAANTGKVDGPTAHAEMNVLTKASRNGHLPAGTKLISTCEPCPMCMGAAIWTGVEEIYFGVSIDQASSYMKQIMVSSQQISEAAFHSPLIHSGVCLEECLALFKIRQKP